MERIGPIPSAVRQPGIALARPPGPSRLAATVLARVHADLSDPALVPGRDNIELALALRELASMNTDLERIENNFRALMEALEEGLVLLDGRGRVTVANRNATRLLGGGEAAVQDWIWSHAQYRGAQAMHPALETLLDGKTRSGVALRWTPPGGGQRWLAVNTRTVAEPAGGLAGVVCSFTDVTGSKSQEIELEKLATIDPLTGAFNRRYLDQRLAAEISRARRFGHPLALGLADLDRFKSVNDRHGHPGGDRALQLFASVLREALRLEDVVARLGGDEFCMIFPATGARAAAVGVERALARLRTADIDGAGGPFRISGTFGIAELRPGAGAAELLSEADAALYAAKAAGGARLAIHADVTAS